MTKYEGIEKADARVCPSGEVRIADKKRRGGYFAGLIARCLIAAALLCAAFGIRAWDSDFAALATERIREAVSFDVFGRENDQEYLVSAKHEA